MNYMIVAHTDDELLWGWKDLLNGEEWTVICIFQQYNYNGANEERMKRLQTFNKSSMLFGFKYISFDFIDNPYSLEIDFKTQENIKSTINKITHEYNKIVTHNPEGEYGHYHHKVISKIVTQIVYDKNKLFYFSFDEQSNTEFTDNYNILIKEYFPTNVNDKTVIGHKKLSNISKTVKYNDYKYDQELIEKFYPEAFLKCRLITCKKYI